MPSRRGLSEELKGHGDSSRLFGGKDEPAALRRNRRPRSEVSDSEKEPERKRYVRDSGGAKLLKPPNVIFLFL